MKKLTLLLLLVTCTFTSFAGDKIKIACIGNSITFGAGIKDRDNDSYPAQLQRILGKEYNVQNFGVSARTTLSKGNFPYIKTPQYKQSLEFNPDIVLIKLGTNDSKTHNFCYIDEFETDYKRIIDSYKALDSKPEIILITPLKCYLTSQEAFKISNRKLVETISPMIADIAYDYDLEIINGYPLCGDKLVESILPDKLHPSAEGAEMMAEHFAKVITQTRDDDYNIFDQLGEGKEFNFYGYQGMEYSKDDLNYKVVQPRRANRAHSWVLRARFWGHQPQLDRKLLEMGFHILYCDVADLYGSKEAVKRWDKFYKIAHAAGLQKQVVLEGMSRGGLIVYNWATKNPQKVAAIYADAPVLDLKSWPMGCDSAKGDVKKMLKAYGAKDCSKMEKFKGNPIDKVKKIARADIPIIHVVGDADDVVPCVDNSYKFRTIMQSYGSDIEMITKPEVGHHPHSLGDPSPIANFILKAVSQLE